MEKQIFWIDLFSGAGGTTTGIHQAQVNAKVVACVNHNANAIKSHYANHPDCLHLTEDIRDFNVVLKLTELVLKLRIEFPNCVINLHASLECTNYSKAKGGLPRDADSRTLAEHLFMYIKELDPDYVFIENVREFMAWGPLDENGKPISRMNGIDYIRWKETIQSFGYDYDFRLLNSADFGAYQSRERYFGQFAKKGFPISWPEATHSKKRLINSGNELFVSEDLKPWQPVKEILRFDIEGESIFTRKKPLVEATLKRIYAGLMKFVAKGETSFIKKYYSGRPEGKVISTDGPAGTVKCTDGQALVQPSFLVSYFGKGKSHSIDEPCNTITTKDRYAKIQPVHINFIDQQYGNSKPKSIEEPSGSLTSNPKQNLVQAEMKSDFSFIKRYNGGNPAEKVKSIECPIGAISTNGRHALVQPYFLMNPQFNSKGSSIDNPCFTLIARMDKMPPYLIHTETGQVRIQVFSEDSETMILIKEFMATFGIVDIKMRMLMEEELLAIQGFPKNYKLIGTQTDRKRMIGNAVHTKVQQAITEANSKAISKIKSVA